MATKEITVEEKLRALYDLQLIDSRIDRIKNLRGELPLEVKDLADNVSGLETRIEKLKEELKSINEEVSDFKNEIKSSQDSIDKYNTQLKNVKNNREYSALTSEIEYKELEIQACDKNIKKCKANVEFKNEAIKSSQEKLKVNKELLKIKKSELDNLIAETEAEETKLLEKSEELAKKIEERLLRAYKKIRASFKNGLAVVPVERGASFGSYFTIPSQRQLEISQRKKIISDEHSGRILVDAALAQEETEKINKFIEKINK